MNKVCSVLLASVAQAAFPTSPIKSIEAMSIDQNEITDSGLIGTIVGYSVFGLFYFTAVIMIFFDIKKDYKHYSELVEEDLAEMKKLGLEDKMAEFDEQLQLRLKGIRPDDGMDDQLLGAAANLKEGQYSLKAGGAASGAAKEEAVVAAEAPVDAEAEKPVIAA